jgi:hypothetical protein
MVPNFLEFGAVRRLRWIGLFTKLETLKKTTHDFKESTQNLFLLKIK